MPRVAREKSESGIYHVMVRGINRDDIFFDEADHMRYLQTIARVKNRIEFSVLAYCLMSNHVHLLLKEGDGVAIGQVMQRIGTSFVQWYNAKYERVGHLFQDRFLSVPVNTDEQFLAVLRYIHRNPVNAGITKTCLEYVWSSHAAYALKVEHFSNLTDCDFAIEIGGGRTRLLQLLDAPTEAKDYEVADEPFATTDSEVLALVHLLLGGTTETLQEMPKSERDNILWRLKLLPGAGVTQIARLTGLSKATVSRAKETKTAKED